MLAVTFYTENTKYEDEARQLEKSLLKFNIPYKFYPIESTGNHVKNVQHKPSVILQALEQSEENIIWMDADNIVLDYPTTLMDLDTGKLPHDFASVILWGRPSRNPMVNNWKLAANVMFFRNNAAMHKVCQQWDDECSGGKWSDHYYLMKVLLANKDINVYYLPMQYMRKIPLTAFGESDHVVLHKTASRKVFSNQWRI